MKIVLLGQFGSGNTGNDGSLEAMLNFLRASKMDTDLLCVCSNPKAVSEKYHINAINIGSYVIQSSWFNRINAILADIPRRLMTLYTVALRLRGTDLLLIPGTGILDDFQDTTFGWPFVILRWCLAARLHSARVAFVSIGAGPIKQSLSRIFLKAAARMANYRSYRDRHSRDFMESIGFDINRDRVSADLAFGLPTPAEPVRRNRRTLCVGLGVMTYSGWRKAGNNGEAIYRTYLGKIAELILWLHEHGLKVRLLSGDVVDRQAISDIMGMIGPTHAVGSGIEIIAEETTSLHDVMAQIAWTDIVVATRYHNVVCALQMGRPVISLGYATKNDALLAATGLGEYCHHVETFDLEVLKQQIETMLADCPHLTLEVKKGVAVFRSQLAEQEAVLRATLFDIPEQEELMDAGQLPQS